MDAGKLNRSRRVPVTWIIALGAMIWSALPHALWAQPGPFPIRRDRADSKIEQNATWADRSILQRLAAARVLMSEQRDAEAVRYLGLLLELPEDYFVPAANDSRSLRSLKGSALELLGKASRQGRESYELQFGARAKQLLGEALTQGDSHKLADVSRQFFYTQAGLSATLLLGLNALERGQPLAGALALDRLRGAGPDASAFEPLLSLSLAACWLQAGNESKSRQALLDFKRQYAKKTVSVDGREVAVFSEGEDPIVWLRDSVGFRNRLASVGQTDWAMELGDPARSSRCEGGMPLLNRRWRASTLEEPAIETAVLGRVDQWRNAGLAEVPLAEPLATGDVVLFRTLRTLVAVNQTSGKRLWETPTDEDFRATFARLGIQMGSSSAPEGWSSLERRLWSDRMYTGLSSENGLVFSVEDVSFESLPFSHERLARFGLRPNLDDETVSRPNRLTAREIETGKLKWQVGGPAGPAAARLAEHCFLGAPLPLAGRLYALAETKHEIRLVVLDAATGETVWSQQLGIVDSGEAARFALRYCGAAPSYSDGILVCPLPDDTIVGVELGSRLLRWRHSVAAGAAVSDEELIGNRFGSYRNDRPEERWMLLPPRIAAGRVVLGPMKTKDIRCLDLVDGSLLWKIPRTRELFIACADAERVAIVGASSVAAVRLRDGKAAWTKPISFVSDATPSGRGFRAGDLYYLPLSNGQLIAVDLARGEIVASARSWDRRPLGNLVCHGDRVISQSNDRVEAFYQRDALAARVGQRLAADPHDAEALARRAELALERRQFSEAIDAISESYRLAPCDYSRALLRKCLFDALTNDFAANQARIAALEPILDSPEDRARLLRLQAEGHSKLEQWKSAVDCLAKLLAIPGSLDEMVEVSERHNVVQSYWVRSRLKAIRLQKDPEAAAAVDRLAAAQWTAARDTDAIESWQRFVAVFGGLPAGEEARRILIDRFRAAKRFLEAELLVWPDRASSDPAVSGAATAVLASLARAAKQPADAAILLAELNLKYSDVIVENGHTGRQVFDAIPPDDPARRFLEISNFSWSKGQVVVTQKPSPRKQSAPYGGWLRLEETAGPFFDGVTLRMDRRPESLAARELDGKQRWRASFSDVPLTMNDMAAPVYGVQASSKIMADAAACGHLLVVLYAGRPIAIDTLSAGSGGVAKRLWPAENQRWSAPVSRPLERMWRENATPSLVAADAAGLGPVTERYVCVIQSGQCRVLDPISGKTMWSRPAPRNGNVYGDRDFLVIDAPKRGPESRSERDILVYRADDGSLVDRRDWADDWQAIVAHLGRRLVMTKRDKKQETIELYDPAERRAVWGPIPCRGEFQADPVAKEVGWMFDDKGRLTVLSLSDGRSVMETTLPLAEMAASIQTMAKSSGEAKRRAKDVAKPSSLKLLPYEDRWIVIATYALRDGDPFGSEVTPLPGMEPDFIAYGLVYGFERDGRPAWPKPVPIQQQHFAAAQPADLPCLVFGAMVEDAAARRSSRHVTSLLAIDKRSGRAILRQKLAGTTGLFDVTADREKQFVEIEADTQPGKPQLFRLQYTENPWPPGQSAEVEPTQDPDAKPWGQKLLEALRRSMDAEKKPEKKP